jgi:hypothetical protein
MPILNEIVLDTARGFRKITLAHGDVAKLGEPVDLIIVSAFRDEYSPLPGTVLGSLYQTGISVADLSAQPEIDLREPLGCWISRAIEGQAFRRVMCIFSSNEGEIDFPSRVRDCAKAVAVLEVWDSSTRRVAMPLLGTGHQGLEPRRIARAIVTAAAQVLEMTLRVDAILLVEIDFQKATLISGAIDELLGRKKAVLGTGGLSNTIRVCLSETLGTLRILSMEPESARIIKRIIALNTPEMTLADLQEICRELCERLAHEVLPRIPIPRTTKLAQAIASLDIHPKWVRTYLHVLREAGNRKAHPGEKIIRDMDQEDFPVVLTIVNRLLSYWHWWCEGRLALRVVPENVPKIPSISGA